MSRSSGPLSTTSSQLRAVRLKSANKHIFRALLSLASAALLIRVFGMLNQIVVTGRFGAGATMDAYFVATVLPLLLANLLGSALEASVIPVYARMRAQGKEQASELYSTMLNLLVLGCGLCTILMLAFRSQMIYLSAPALDPYSAGLAISLTPFIYPVLVLMVMVGFLNAILSVEGQFGWPAYAGLLVPLTTVILVLTLGRFGGVFVLCIGILVGTCLQLCVVLVRARRAGLAYRLVVNLRHPAIGAILVAAWPLLIGALIDQASPLVDQIFASYLSAGSISALSYALKLLSVPVGVIFISVGRAALPYLSRQASTNDMKAFKETLRLYLWAVGAATIVIAVLMFVLAHPIVQILFQRGAFTADDTSHTASTLRGFVPGLVPMALGFLTARAFSALGKTRVLMGVTAFSVLANAAFDYIFARFWLSTGIAVATSAVYFCTMFMLFFMLQRKIGRLNLFTPPSQLLLGIRKIGYGSHYLELVSRKQNRLLPFGIPSGVRQKVVRVGIALVVFVLGIGGVLQNTAYALRAALGSLVVLALLRYRYVVLIAWVMLDVFIGSSLQIFQGNNFDTGLTVPTLLLMTCMPITQTFRRMPALACLLIYVMWVFASIGISPVSGVTFLTSWLLMLDLVAVGVLAINLLTTRRRLLGLIDAILLVTTFVSLYGIYGYVTKQNGIGDPATSLFRISSIFGQTPPTLAFFLSMIIPLAIYRTLTLRGFKRVGGVVLVLVFLVSLGLTFTRSAFISMPLSIIVLILFLPSGKMRIGLLSGILALAALAVLVIRVGNLPIFDRFFNQDITTLNGRTYIWQALLDHFDPTQLLGNGLDAATTLLTNLRVGFGGGVIGTAAHNLFLGALYDHGIIGVTLLILTFATLVIGLITGVRKAVGDQRALVAAVLAVLVNVFLQSLDSNDIWSQSICIYFWIIMALPFALCWTAAKQSPETEQEAFDDEPTVPRLPVVEGQGVRELLVSGIRDEKK
jgi:murein biosynthesis integral membrane protein MurJ